MNSKVSYFNRSLPLLMDSLRRFWPLPVLAFFLYFFAATFSITLDLAEGNDTEFFLYQIICNQFDLYSLIHLIVPIFSALLAFRYLQSGGSSTTVHALPCTRTQLFNSSFVTGWLLCALPLLANNSILLAASMTMPDNYDPAIPIPYTMLDSIHSQAAVWFWESLLIVSVIYTTAVLAGVLTGNTISHFAVALGLNLLIPAALTLLQIFSEIFLFGYPADISFGQGPLVTAPMFLDLGKIDLATAGLILAAVLALLYAASLLLYRRRSLEKNGILVFRPVYTICCCLATLAGTTTLIVYLISSDAPTYLLWGSAVGSSFLLYIILRMVGAKSLHVFNQETWKGLTCYALAMILLLAGFQTGGFGYEDRIPPEDNISSSFSEPEFFNSYGFQQMELHPNSKFYLESEYRLQLKTPENKEALKAFHQSILDSKDELRALESIGTAELHPMTLGYVLNNGRELKRTYQLPYSFLYASKELKTIYESEEYKERLLINQLDLNLLESISLERSRPDPSGSSDTSVFLSKPDELSAFINCLRADIKAETFEELMSLHIPYASVRLTAADPIYQDHKIEANFDLPKTFTSTIDWLRSQGYEDQFSTDSSQVSYAAVMPGGDDKERYALDTSFETLPAQTKDLMIITDPSLISDILDSCDRLPANQKECYSVQLVTDRSGSYSNRFVYLSPENIPSYMRDYFKAH